MTALQVTGILATTAHILIVLVSAVLISTHRRPSTAIAWLLTIIFIPFVGIVAFLLVGTGRLPRWRREIQRDMNLAMLERDEITRFRTLLPADELFTTNITLNEKLGALPMVAKNNATLYKSYAGSFAAMIQDIDTAQRDVHVEFYILVYDDMTAPFFDALARAARRGVSVRVLSDHVSGLMFPRRRETQDFFAENGIQWCAMLPLRPHRRQWQRPDMRNHRKLVVIDDHIAFTGSQNLIHESYLKPKNVRRGLHWQELMIRLDGPVAGELNAVFATDWLSETAEHLEVRTLQASGNPPFVEDPPTTPEIGGETRNVDAQVVPSGPSFENDNNLKLFVSLMQQSHRRLSITSPYFVPDEASLLAIVTAASRGVDVELFVSEIGDQPLVYHAQRSYYQALLDAGVKIYLYRSPTVLHSKHFSVDDDIAVIGSSNMDNRSFSINMEVSVLIRNTEFVQRLRAVEDDYRANSRLLSDADWNNRPLRERVSDSLARLTSSLQ